VTWLNGWIHLRSITQEIARDIMCSYATTPPKPS
jgi:hypothetical protein